jgi:prevent-host-death family protein
MIKMNILPQIVPASELRHKISKVLLQVKKQSVVLTWRGRPRAVLVDYDAYSTMTARQSALEEARDALLLQRATETATNYLPFEALVQQHRELFGEDLDVAVQSVASAEVNNSYTEA